ncbi:hypothetical protein [Plantactinospora sp. KLBMP9567]|nr:hypothetical protein [Plantactinospora sp. KLBMP9567]MDW5327029.1 hypothetical protein [Plantactinospora sp. KLBMP9567]
MDVLDQVLVQTTADPRVRGVVPTGSRARGVATAGVGYRRSCRSPGG